MWPLDRGLATGAWSMKDRLATESVDMRKSEKLFLEDLICSRGNLVWRVRHQPILGHPPAVGILVGFYRSWLQGPVPQIGKRNGVVRATRPGR